jgi:hypothetical protein
LLTVGANHIENDWLSGDPSTSACESPSRQVAKLHISALGPGLSGPGSGSITITQAHPTGLFEGISQKINPSAL